MPLAERLHCAVRLVRHDRNTDTVRAERGKQLQNAVVRLRPDLTVRGIVRLVERKCLLHLLLAAALRQSAPDEHIRAVAHKGSHFSARPLGVSEGAQRVIHALIHILQRVEDRPVHVK